MGGRGTRLIKNRDKQEKKKKKVFGMYKFAKNGWGGLSPLPLLPPPPVALHMYFKMHVRIYWEKMTP